MIWLSVKETSKLLGYEESTIRKKAKTKQIRSRYTKPPIGQGGKDRLEILLESLPEQAQVAYHNKNGDECQIVFNTNHTYTKSQRKKGELRALAVSEHRRYKAQSIKNGITKKTEIMDAFVSRWNQEHSDFQITNKSLYDWMKKSKMGNVEKLSDRRGGYNRGQSSIDPKYQKYFQSLYLQQAKPTIQSCFNETKLYANSEGDIIPGIKAFRLFVKNMDNSMIIRAREGKKAFDDKCVPYIERDYSLIAPNEWWVSDHHLWDIFVRISDGSGGWKLARPWGSYWMDMRTRKMISSIIRIESPNSDVVLCSFGLGVEHFGVPEGVRLDNGKDYKARDMFYPEGKYICSEEDEKNIANSLASNLSVKVTYAIPYNAKAKPIERVFNTYEEQLGKKYASYAGSNAKMRPEDLKDIDIMDVITLEEFIEQHNRFVYEIYNESSHSGDAMYNNSPNHMYSKVDFTIRRVPRDVLYFSLMRVKGNRVVGRNGITFNGIHFYNDNCINYIGQKVTARYDPTKSEILYVFDINGNFLFIAQEVQKQGWNLTQEDYQRENERKKIARQKALNNYTADNTIRSVESIGDRLKRQADDLDKAPIARPKTIEIVQNEKIKENLKRISLSDIERNYEDVLAQNAVRRNEVTSKQKELAERFKQNMLDRASATAKQA